MSAMVRAGEASEAVSENGGHLIGTYAECERWLASMGYVERARGLWQHPEDQRWRGHITRVGMGPFRARFWCTPSRRGGRS